MSRSNRRFLGIPDVFWIGFVIMVGFFLKLVYVSKVGYVSGTPNPGTFLETADAIPKGGSLEVISYFFNHHYLADFNPRGLAGYAEPPLYYIICSLFMELLHRVMRWSVSISLYFVLALNVVYVMVGECAGISILQKFGVRGRKQMVGVLFLISFPPFYHLSASMNGWALSFMLSMLALSGALSWYASRREKVLRNAAIELGLALMTSYAAILVLPAMIVIFVYASRDGRRNQTPPKIQFRNCALIVSLMGLIWPVYLSVRFNLPLLYVEPSGAKITGTLMSPIFRLSVPNSVELTHLHSIGSVRLESNIWAQIFKTALVNIHALDLTLSGTELITLFLHHLLIALAVLSHVMLIYSVFFAKKIDKIHSTVLFVGYVTALAAYIISCFVVPYTGTPNFNGVTFLVIFPLVGMCVCGSGDFSDNLFETVTTVISNGAILIAAFITAFLFGFYY